MITEDERIPDIDAIAEQWWEVYVKQVIAKGGRPKLKDFLVWLDDQNITYREQDDYEG